MNNYTIEEVTQYIKENDVKFIRLAFCDIFGNMKNVSIMPSELDRAFVSGIPFDASAVRGFMDVEDSDLFLFPDSTTLQILPWRPSQGRVARFFCDIKMPDGTPFGGNGREILRRAIDKAKALGYTVKIGTECEFYLFELDENGKPTRTTHDKAGYCDIAPFDKGETVRREICLTLEEMDMMPEMSHHEQGKGQHEVDFRYSEALTAADNLVNFKAVVKNIASRNGLYASFMPKPILNDSGSGLHINMSLFKDGVNVFDLSKSNLQNESGSFVAGIIEHIKEMSAFTNPLTNSYARLGEFSAPKYITWSHGNRSQLIRIPASYGEFKRMELRNPDPSCSPYLTFALLIHAGIDGITSGKVLTDPTNCNLFKADKKLLNSLPQMPSNLGEAIEIARASSFIPEVIPKDSVDRYLAEKEKEWKEYLDSEFKEYYEIEKYFDRV